MALFSESIYTNNVKINAYGRLLEIIKENEHWSIYVLGEGKKSLAKDIIIPPTYNEQEALEYLADMLHEAATPQNPDIKIVD